ncbi:flavin reductase family protein [Pseudonocardia spinosispora]|uniref:flavin reductase family protein n=1 Tax=Pseudonocardia spinosispora TaxID=103441 RepID=UPI00068704FC|nr:flavin reductase family protein [Pseudonocardia spinosispora]
MPHPDSAPPAGGISGAFTAVMGGLATSVTVVGAAHDGDRAAQTVSAMCSVSAEPPMLLVCVHRRSPVNALIRDSGRFSVNVLATRHDHVADTFAGRPWPGKQRWDFTCGEWVGSDSGTPRLADALAFFDCAAHSTVEAGSHLVHIGRINTVRSEPGTPLIYAGRTYAAPSPVPPSRFPDFPDAHPDNRYVPEQQAPARREASA